MNTKPNCAALVSVSDRTAEMVMLLADIKETHSKALALLADDETGLISSEANEAAKTALASYYGFWRNSLLQMIESNIEANKLEI